jgi:serine O-acetyltransferase
VASLLSVIKEDLQFYGGTNANKKVLTFLFKHSFSVMLNYRLGRHFLQCKFPFSNLFVIYLKHRQLKYGSCHISYEACIGKRLNLPHPVGIVIGKGVVVKDNVTIYQNCTLGQKDDSQYPVLNDYCIVYPGSIVVGDTSIGENAIIGANSFVNKSVGAGSVFINKK